MGEEICKLSIDERLVASTPREFLQFKIKKSHFIIGRL